MGILVWAVLLSARAMAFSGRGVFLEMVVRVRVRFGWSLRRRL